MNEVEKIKIGALKKETSKGVVMGKDILCGKINLKRNQSIQITKFMRTHTNQQKPHFK